MEYSFMDVDLDSAVEPEVFPEDTEVQLEIVEAKTHDDPEKCMIICQLKPLGTDGFHRKIKHNLNFPRSEDDAEKKNNKLLMIKRFYEAFGVQTPLTDPDQLVGLSGWVTLNVVEEPPYPKKNEIKAFTGVKK